MSRRSKLLADYDNSHAEVPAPETGKYFHICIISQEQNFLSEIFLLMNENIHQLGQKTNY
jgi:hypothetical protein